MIEVKQRHREAAADLIESYWCDGSNENIQMRKLAQSYRQGHSQGVWAHAFAEFENSLSNAKAPVEENTKFCKDCIYYSRFAHICNRPISEVKDLVTGEHTRLSKYADNERNSDRTIFGREKCGASGKFFRPK